MHLLADSGWTTGLFLAALAMTIFILLRRTHRYLARQKRDNSPMVQRPRPEKKQAAHHLDAPTDAIRWEVQMHETARELSAQLDSKMSALQTLIADADRAARRLETAMAQSSGQSAPNDRPASTPPTQAEALRPSHAADERTDRPPAVPASSRHRQQEIYALADYGLDAREIAGRVGVPIGEVELILGLRDRT